MRALAAGFVCAFIVALCVTPFVRRMALHLGALDPVSARKVVSRKTTVPRLGGLGIALGFYVTLLLLWLAQSTLFSGVVAEGPRIVALLLGGVPILLLGCIDDLRGMRALTKLSVQIIVAAALWYVGLRVGGGTSLWQHWELPVWASFAVTVLWITGIINAVNLIDGLDGLASGVAFFALFATAATAILRGDLVLALFTVTLAGAVLGFLLFNWNPASIFMGDAGSMFLGYLLATTSIWTVQKAATAVLVIFPAVALGLPLLDTSLTIGRRLLSGRPVMQADRDHVHHRLLGKGLSHRETVVLLYAVCAVFSGLSVAMVFAEPQTARFLLCLAALFAVALAYVLGYVRSGQDSLLHGLRQRGRNRALQQELTRLGTSLEGARDVAELQEAVRGFARALGTVDLRLILHPETSPAYLPSEISPVSRMPGPFVQRGTCYAIRTQDHVLGRIESRTAECNICPDDRVLMQLLCDLLAPPLRRLTLRRSGRFQIPRPGATLTDPSLEKA